MPLPTDLADAEDLGIDPADLDAIATLIRCVADSRELGMQLIEGTQRQLLAVEPGTHELAAALWGKLLELGVV